MASSAFKSTTNRTPIGASSSSSIDDSSSSSRSSLLRRSRSLSRVSRRLPEPSSDCSGEIPSSRGRFVNTTRGSGFTDISLDDLAVEFFGSGQRCRSSLLDSEASPTTGDSLSQRRGRSVSRQASRISGVNGDVRGNVSGNSVREKVTSDFSSSSRRRRSLSVVRCQISDSEVSIVSIFYYCSSLFYELLYLNLRRIHFWLEMLRFPRVLWLLEVTTLLTNFIVSSKGRSFTGGPIRVQKLMTITRINFSPFVFDCLLSGAPYNHTNNFSSGLPIS